MSDIESNCGEITAVKTLEFEEIKTAEERIHE